MRLVVDLTLPTEARLISQTRRAFTGYLEEMGVDGDDVSDVALALAEACTNVLRHACTRGDSFRLSAELGPDEVVLVVEDDGIGLPPSADRAPSTGPEATATSGRGLFLIRALMTSVVLETTPARQGTKLQMRKSLKGHSAAAEANAAVSAGG